MCANLLDYISFSAIIDLFFPRYILTLLHFLFIAFVAKKYNFSSLGNFHSFGREILSYYESKYIKGHAHEREKSRAFY